MNSTAQPSETPPATVADALNADRSLRILDAKIETAYGQALDRVSRYPKLAETVRSEQAYYSQYQDDALSFGHANLKRLMQTWLPWLNAIDAPRGGFGGAWTSSGSNLQISPRKGGGYNVLATGSEPVTGAHYCELTGIGQIKGGIMTVSGVGLKDDDMMGWTVSLRHTGGLLHMDQNRNNSEFDMPPFCGAINLLGGDYMPTRTTPEPVKAWK